MKGAYIYYSKTNPGKESGIDKKVISQIHALNNEGLNCHMIVLPQQNRFIDKIVSRLPFANTMPEWVYMDDFNNLDYIYIRRPICITSHTIKVLKQIKKKNRNIKIIYEIPTYPYDKEFCVRKRDIPFLIKDRYNRTKLNGLIDRIVTFTDHKSLFGIPTIRITNGFDLDSINVKSAKKENKTIIITAVAMYADWHGYERFIEGLGKYYESGGTREIVFNIVGDGNQTKKYRKLADYYKISDNIIFHGKKIGEELNKIYDETDIAVDVLGMYKKDNSISSSLKSREYLAKGLPIILGCSLDLLNENDNFKYYIEFENNPNPIDIEEVVKFYDKIYCSKESREEIIRNIREFANSTCDISRSIKKIVEYIKDKNTN